MVLIADKCGRRVSEAMLDDSSRGRRNRTAAVGGQGRRRVGAAERQRSKQPAWHMRDKWWICRPSGRQRRALPNAARLGRKHLVDRRPAFFHRRRGKMVVYFVSGVKFIFFW